MTKVNFFFLLMPREIKALNFVYVQLFTKIPFLYVKS